MTASLGIETGSHSDIGGREEQQDRVAVLNCTGGHLLVVADGMGGHQGGAVAAQAVVDAASHCFSAGDIENSTDLLAAIIEEAHRRINDAGIELGCSPRTTCVLLHVSAGMASWAHVGDSRLYRFQEGRLMERTLDHSVVELMRLQGRITEQEMADHPDQSRLYEALGGPEPPNPDVGGTAIAPGMGFLLMSDGMWEHVPERLLEAVMKAPDLNSALRELALAAKSVGGPRCDNLSVAAWRIKSNSAGMPCGHGNLAVLA